MAARTRAESCAGTSRRFLGAVSLRSLVEVSRRRCWAIKVEEKLGRDGEQAKNEFCFRDNIALCHPSDSPLADHAHRFDALESSPSTLKGTVPLGQPGSLFDGSMILFNDIVEILAPAQTNSAGESPLGFQGFHCSRIGRVLIQVGDPRNGIGG